MPKCDEITVNLKIGQANTFPALLARAAKRFTPATIIDVGASDGSWSRMAHEVWPHACILTIEANPIFIKRLQATCYDLQAYAIGYQALCTSRVTDPKKLRIYPKAPYQGVYDPEDNAHVGGEIVEVPVTTIDALMESYFLPGPFLIKLDVHGREHEILEGARNTLKSTAGLVIEVYTWSQGANSMRAVDLIPHIERLYGFLPSDICEPLRRPLDERMVQYDCLFELKTAAFMDTARYE